MTDDGPGGDWILEPVPWREIAASVADADEPLIGASWRGTPVAVVAPKVIEEWAAATRAAFFPTANRNAQVVDVPATLEAEGVTGLLPPNALVVKNCAGIQLGNGNSQTNIHRFRVEDVRITLDKSLARKLAAGVVQVGLQPPAQRPPARGHGPGDPARRRRPRGGGQAPRGRARRGRAGTAQGGGEVQRAHVDVLADLLLVALAVRRSDRVLELPAEAVEPALPAVAHDEPVDLEPPEPTEPPVPPSPPPAVKPPAPPPAVEPPGPGRPFRSFF
ncbi:RIP homotypic interaction motif-containing protein [Amycolatopsis sp. DG1A-15b]|uniref:RIP homotypic interaction motif-containing protein n=1 Tax=Amycolatopsis sp. DG1A-15b TaxID=3052846 RepID=UPI00255B77AF|nr:RIP homotypic interaction motif-containing protein [Amycolatopsis sp. DG1A-15b]WIX84912.1 RIP homotypic interaction motif-containing protein [Amycolatopsis sp. DG1A-15b]